MVTTEALNRPQKGPNMVLNCKFSQPHSQYSVRARVSVRSRLILVKCWLRIFLIKVKKSRKCEFRNTNDDAGHHSHQHYSQGGENSFRCDGLVFDVSTVNLNLEKNVRKIQLKYLPFYILFSVSKVPLTPSLLWEHSQTLVCRESSAGKRWQSSRWRRQSWWWWSSISGTLEMSPS